MYMYTLIAVSWWKDLNYCCKTLRNKTIRMRVLKELLNENSICMFNMITHSLIRLILVAHVWRHLRKEFFIYIRLRVSLLNVKLRVKYSWTVFVDTDKMRNQKIALNVTPCAPILLYVADLITCNQTNVIWHHAWRVNLFRDSQSIRSILVLERS